MAEQRCGTCAYWKRCDHVYGTCAFPMSHVALGGKPTMTEPTDGADCTAWRAQITGVET